MQRKILFRSFHPCDGPDTILVDGEKIKGRWVEGYIVRHPSAIQIGNDYSPWYIHVPPVDPDDNGGVFNVLPSTVGQYTGLKDSSGKRVFEGDILKFRDEPNNYEWIGRMEFGNPNCGYTWGFQLVHLSGPEPNIDTLCWFDMEEGGAYSEVVGTIWDEEAQNGQS